MIEPAAAVNETSLTAWNDPKCFVSPSTRIGMLIRCVLICSFRRWSHSMPTKSRIDVRASTRATTCASATSRSSSAVKM